MQDNVSNGITKLNNNYLPFKFLKNININNGIYCVIWCCEKYYETYKNNEFFNEKKIGTIYFSKIKINENNKKKYLDNMIPINDDLWIILESNKINVAEQCHCIVICEHHMENIKYKLLIENFECKCKKSKNCIFQLYNIRSSSECISTNKKCYDLYTKCLALLDNMSKIDEKKLTNTYCVLLDTQTNHPFDVKSIRHSKTNILTIIKTKKKLLM